MRVTPRSLVLVAVTVVASTAPSCGFDARTFGGDAAAPDASALVDADDDEDLGDTGQLLDEDVGPNP